MTLAGVIGLRYARSRNGYLSFISLVSLLGLVVGVVALTVVVSVMNGFDRELKRRILGVVPHLVVAGQPAQVSTQERNLAAHPGVKAVAPFIRQSGLLVKHGNSYLVSLYGILPGREAALSILPTTMVSGSFQALDDPEPRLLLGEPIARYLGLAIGDEFTLIVPTPSAQGRTLKPTLGRVRLAGTFTAGSELDSSLALMNLEQLQRLSGQTPGYRLRLQDIFAAPRVAGELLARGEVVVHDWTRTHGDFFRTVKMEKVMMFVLLSFVIAVAAFGIVSGLSMMVNTKRREIAVLRTIGLSGPGIMGVFVVQGMAIAVPGILAGLLLGVPLAWYAPELMAMVESLLGASMVAGTYFDQIPTDVRLPDLLAIALVALLISLCASLYPSWRASRLAPAEGLRYE